ncbi:hypothetical protein HanIR_Chr12g0578501 [Helianthus annuus]|nr:hypothetical protein HanIR_Chr12g0578501 [Helianthus annuus]
MPHTRSQGPPPLPFALRSSFSSSTSEHPISVAHLNLTPAAKERVLAFKKLDPEVRSFQVIIQDSQEISSASATMSSAGKSARSVKSASMFGISDLANVTSSKKKKAPAASPSVSAPKAPARGKGKKRKASDDLQGFPLLRQQFLDYFDEDHMCLMLLSCCLL